VTDKARTAIVQMSNPTAFAGRGSIIVFELTDNDAALSVAQKIAEETGRCVTVRDADMNMIGCFVGATTYCERIAGKI
jgi:pyrroline-5-carboxylate reductase